MNFLMKHSGKVRSIMFTLCILMLSVTTLPIEIFAQAAQGPLQELRDLLSPFFLTEAAFLGAITLLTEPIIRITKLENSVHMKLVGFVLTLIGALIGHFWDLGIFAEMGIVATIWFAFMKSLAEIGLYEWIKEGIPVLSKRKG